MRITTTPWFNKFDLRILNWFLIEKMAFGRHVCGARGVFSALPEACLREPSKKISETHKPDRGVQDRVT
jgi:hypothetical protein